MFIGHFGVALGAKSVAPRTSLGTLFFAAQFADLLWPLLLLAGVEHVRVSPGITKVQPFDFYDYPVSHSLATLAAWSVLVGGLYYAWRRYGRGAWVVGLCVLSHWFLDLVVHRPDLPLWPGGGMKVGLGLWTSWPAAIGVESLTFAAGLGIYLGCTRARDGVGRYALWGLVVLLAASWLGAIFGPPPPNVTALALTGLGMWIFVLWGWWVDRHREIRVGG